MKSLILATACVLGVCLPDSVLGEPYAGLLYDGHAHLSGRSSPEKAAADFKAAGFEKAVLFSEVGKSGSIIKAGKGRFLVFVDPFERKKVRVRKNKKETRYTFSEKRLAKIIDALDKKEVLGFGEIYFRLGYAPFAPKGIKTDIRSKGARALLSTAKRYDAPVHIHLDADHVGTLVQLLKGNREVRFVLAHCGFFEPAQLASLMREHPNLFAETSLIFNPYIERFANLPIKNGELKPDWKELLETHADRMMLGTDYTSSRAEQLPKLADYYRQVLALLPRAQADMIARGTFARLFLQPK